MSSRLASLVVILASAGALSVAGPTVATVAPAPPATVGGTVKSISEDGKLITVTVGSGKSARDQQFHITPKSKITLDGKSAKAQDLVEGTRVTLSYDKSTRGVVAIRAVTAKPEAMKKESTATKAPTAPPSRSSRTKPDAGTASAATKPSGEWPQWRGPNRDGVSKETGLLKQWPEGGPPLTWTFSGLGKGTSSVSISNGRIFTMGTPGKDECLIALELDGSKELWATPIGSSDTKFSHREPKSTPTVDGDLVFVVGMNGTLACIETATGRLHWRKDFETDFGGRMMTGWGWSESPLVDGDKVVCTPGGDQATLVALNKKTGQLIWRSAVPQPGGSGYSSIVVAEVGGIRQYITLLGQSGGLVGVSAKDGRFLWKYPRIGNGTANIPTAVVRGDLVFCSTGYNAGAALLRLVPAGGGVRIEERYFLSGNDFQNHHGGMVLVGDHIYAGHGQNNGIPTCIDFRTGKIVWGRTRGPGRESGAVVYADGHLYFRYQNAVMALIEATPQGLKVKGGFDIPNGATPSWSHPVVAGGRLYLRDQDRLLCYDIRADRSTARASLNP